MKIIITLISCHLLHLACFCQSDISASDTIINRLKTEKNNGRKMQLILQLSGVPEAQFSPAQYKYLINKLIEWYRFNPDPGVHSAIDYFFRHTKKKKALTGSDWNNVEELEKIGKTLKGRPPQNKNWYLSSEGQTMAIISGPVSFTMGSPENERYRDSDEVEHPVLIPRSFAISTKEITVAQFQKFLDDNPEVKKLAKADSAKDPSRGNKKLLVFSPDENCPQILITWYEAAQYCNWLSKQEGIPEKEWCYPPIDQIRSGMQMPKDNLKRTGYRLPTEAEWEFSCRAGTISTFFFGSSDELLAEYAWYSKNPPDKKSDPIDPTDPKHTFPVGQLRPNQLGLFDMYGNVWEWCQSRRLPYSEGKVEDKEDINIVITDSVPMIRRGGSFSYGKAVMRSAHRGSTNYFPMQRRDNVGFRIARTLR